MLTDRRVRAVLTVAAPIWAALLLLQGVNVDLGFFKPLSAVTGTTIIALGLYDRRLWRWPLLRKLQQQPIVHGTWSGQLVSTWVNPATSKSPDPIEVFMVVHQTASTVRFEMLTAESASRTVSAALEDAEAGAWVLSGMYLNTPELSIQQRSRIHRGSAVMQVHRGKTVLIEGSYWTDRDTRGSLRFDRHSPETVTHVDFARALFA